MFNRLPVGFLILLPSLLHAELVRGNSSLEQAMALPVLAVRSPHLAAATFAILLVSAPQAAVAQTVTPRFESSDVAQLEEAMHQTMEQALDAGSIEWVLSHMDDFWNGPWRAEFETRAMAKFLADDSPATRAAGLKYVLDNLEILQSLNLDMFELIQQSFSRGLPAESFEILEHYADEPWMPDLLSHSVVENPLETMTALSVYLKAPYSFDKAFMKQHTLRLVPEMIEAGRKLPLAEISARLLPIYYDEKTPAIAALHSAIAHERFEEAMDIGLALRTHQSEAILYLAALYPDAAQRYQGPIEKALQSAVTLRDAEAVFWFAYHSRLPWAEAYVEKSIRIALPEPEGWDLLRAYSELFERMGLTDLDERLETAQVKFNTDRRLGGSRSEVNRTILKGLSTDHFKWSEVLQYLDNPEILKKLLEKLDVLLPASGGSIASELQNALFNRQVLDYYDMGRWLNAIVLEHMGQPLSILEELIKPQEARILPQGHINVVVFRDTVRQVLSSLRHMNDDRENAEIAKASARALYTLAVYADFSAQTELKGKLVLRLDAQRASENVSWRTLRALHGDKSFDAFVGLVQSLWSASTNRQDRSRFREILDTVREVRRQADGGAPSRGPLAVAA